MGQLNLKNLQLINGSVHKLKALSHLLVIAAASSPPPYSNGRGSPQPSGSKLDGGGSPSRLLPLRGWWFLLVLPRSDEAEMVRLPVDVVVVLLLLLLLSPPDVLDRAVDPGVVMFCISLTRHWWQQEYAGGVYWRVRKNKYV